jgi:hypothetical protein
MTMQSNIDQRVFFYDDSANSFTDLTVSINEWNNGKTVSLVMAPEDFLYIACFLPFNHKYFRFYTPSSALRSPTVEILNAPSEWSPVVDSLDYTNGFQASGVLQYTPDYDKNWGLVSRSSTDITGFSSGPVVYGAFWLRISFASAATFTLEYIGQKFSSDADLFQEYPMLQSQTILAGWKSGKTNWDDQHLLAANYISKTMIQRGLIYTNNQILDISTLRGPAVHKAAHIIFSGLGARNYAEEIKLAAENFDKAMTQDKFQVDTNANARKDRSEVVLNTTSRASR